MSIVIAKNLSKAYRRYNKPIDSLKELVLRKQYHSQFWALQNATFRCEQNEVLGIVGDNGAGKSTLLKLLAGTVRPTEGELTIKGRVSAILELGSGFHPDYTGLENIHLGCAMLGLSASEISEKVDEIITFSELDKFINEPVKNYSSGMFVRLAFSVVTSVDPDLLVVDEALAVGDQHFQKKSMDRMMEFKDMGKALVFCSHSLYHIKELCKRAIWLDHGKIQMQGDSADVIDQYNDHIRIQNRTTITVSPTHSQSQQPKDSQQLTAYLTEVTLLDAELDSEGSPVYTTGDCFRVLVKAEKQSGLALDDVHVGIVIDRNDGIQCFGVSTVLDGVSLQQTKQNELAIIYEIPALQLLSGQYTLEIWLIDTTSAHIYDSRQSCCPFKFRQPNTEVGVFYVEHQWQPVA